MICDKPKLVFFFDEAHLLFEDATDAFLESVEQTVRLIRSKGVGVFFVTQHADGRARRRCSRNSATGSSTRCGPSRPRMQKALKATVVRPSRQSEIYDLEEMITALGIGEAAVTMLRRRECQRRSFTPGCDRRAR